MFRVSCRRFYTKLILFRFFKIILKSLTLNQEFLSENLALSYRIFLKNGGVRIINSFFYQSFFLSSFEKWKYNHIVTEVESNIIPSGKIIPSKKV
jgi:hypothetical protein